MCDCKERIKGWGCFFSVHVHAHDMYMCMCMHEWEQSTVHILNGVGGGGPTGG